MGRAELAALVAPHLPEDDLILGLGTVRVRAASRHEMMTIQTRAKGNAGLIDALMLQTCLVDPTLTLDDAKAWQHAAPVGEIELVTDMIMALSGMGGIRDEVQKQAYAMFREQSDAGI